MTNKNHNEVGHIFVHPNQIPCSHKSMEKILIFMSKIWSTESEGFTWRARWNTCREENLKHVSAVMDDGENGHRGSSYVLSARKKKQYFGFGLTDLAIPQCPTTRWWWFPKSTNTLGEKIYHSTICFYALSFPGWQNGNSNFNQPQVSCKLTIIKHKENYVSMLSTMHCLNIIAGLFSAKY